MENAVLAYAERSEDESRRFRRLAIGAFAIALGVWAEAWGADFVDRILEAIPVGFGFPQRYYIVVSPYVFCLALVMGAIWMLPRPPASGAGRFGRGFCLAITLLALLLRAASIVTFASTATYAWALYSPPYAIQMALQYAACGILLLEVVLMLAPADYVRRFAVVPKCRRAAAIGRWLLLLSAGLHLLVLGIELIGDLLWQFMGRAGYQWFATIDETALRILHPAAPLLHLGAWIAIGAFSLHIARKVRAGGRDSAGH